MVDCLAFDGVVLSSTMMNNFDQDELMLADLSTDYNADDIIDHINVNELIYSSCNNFAPWTDYMSSSLYALLACLHLSINVLSVCVSTTDSCVTSQVQASHSLQNLKIFCEKSCKN